MRDDDIRDCACGCPPNRHMLERVGNLVVVTGECVDCDCPEYGEGSEEGPSPADRLTDHGLGS